MEVALSRPFLESTILFSLRSNTERNTKYEIWLCHEYMNLSMDDIYKMTVADRKSYIAIHNREIDKQKEKLKVLKKPKGRSRK